MFPNFARHCFAKTTCARNQHLFDVVPASPHLLKNTPNGRARQKNPDDVEHHEVKKQDSCRFESWTTFNSTLVINTVIEQGSPNNRGRNTNGGGNREKFVDVRSSSSNLIKAMKIKNHRPYDEENW